MSAQPQFKRGDVVVHPKRLEWGAGVVENATSIQHEGRAAQRLVVRFDHQGPTTINTAIAPLVAKEGKIMHTHTSPTPDTTPHHTGPQEPRGWLATLEAPKSPHANLANLPDIMTDPFSVPQRRLTATLESYRLAPSGRRAASPRALLEWAIAQTGYTDPLSHFTRHELEEVLPRFTHRRDAHLVELVREVKRSGRLDILREALAQSTEPAARDALQKALKA